MIVVILAVCSAKVVGLVGTVHLQAINNTLCPMRRWGYATLRILLVKGL